MTQQSLRICNQNSKHQFVVTTKDIEFYERMGVLPPTLCPNCRQQRRLAWRGERNFYVRSCDLCGKRLISIFSDSCGFKVFCKECWLSDKWQAHNYGRDFDFNKTFFEQFYALLKKVPLIFSYNIEGENSEYNNNVSFLKNCYLLSSSNQNEDCYYGYFINDSRNCVDCTSIKQSELCYQCVECIQCYDCKYCHNCSNCTESIFMQNCLSCTNCFGCVNLRQKQYCFLNEQLSKDEYIKRLKQIDLGNKQDIEKCHIQFELHRQKYPYKYMIGEQNENVSGNTIFRSKNAIECYDCIDVEDCKFCSQMQESKNCYDVLTWGRPGELLYECMATGKHAYMNRFVSISQESSYNTYCYMCWSSKHLFGCVSMNRAQYCILNKQYSKDDYLALTTRIIEYMKQTKEWSEFFPMSLSPVFYNESLANDFHPLTKVEAESLGARWLSSDSQILNRTNKYQAPTNIYAAQDDIIKQTLCCSTCYKGFRIIEQELKFYKKQNIPLPSQCPHCRHKERIKRKNPRRLFNRNCQKCAIPLRTTYSLEQKEIVYCEKCYCESVY